MRIAWCLPILLALGIAVAAGCRSAARVSAATAPPTADELPRIAQPERIVPARVGVDERDRGQPHVILVPRFEEPELTPEERAALGEEEEPFNWLEFYVAQPEVTRVWPARGGVSTAVYGLGAAVSTESYRLPFSIGRGIGGAATGVLEEHVRYSGHARRGDGPLASPWPGTTLRAGQGPPSHYAGRERRAER